MSRGRAETSCAHGVHIACTACAYTFQSGNPDLIHESGPEGDDHKFCRYPISETSNAVKKLIRVSLAIGAFLLVAGLLAYNALFPPVLTPPPIGRDLPAGFRVAEQVFQQRVEEQFNTGMRTSDLITELERQGFVISENIAQFEKSAFPCMLVWAIYWDDENGTATNLGAVYSGLCL